ncbi:conserved hypothetical protein [Methanococcus vannielii SB]|uniref:UPF0305 protein Mevan_1526 n=1 Tax=Methanococcus vannielii (strain ATCC 35089 / DSM 1224 / JCM 13029 / OCM 148 / SB) TaxID=406327 RepID=A6USE8_METVS|nr:DUF2115 domain-containing protein [Methanococcus vannielii]ABR55420.1 conserved hypothetical protein [Methanococcus vannielii SB]
MNSRKFFRKLKEECFEISIFDIMNAKIYLEKDMLYVPLDYKDKYIEDFFTYFPKILLEIKKKNELEIENFEIPNESIETVNSRIFKVGSKKSGEIYFKKLVKTVLSYLIFIDKKPLHAVTTRFPGGKKIILKDGKYYCPIKDSQSNGLSLCEFCICEDIKSI